MLRNSKSTSCAIDHIPISLLPECLDDILPTLTNIINTSILFGQFLTNMKTAIVMPLLRKCSLDTNKFETYRPVSKFSFISKLKKKNVFQQLVDYLDHSNLCILQSTYRPHHSTDKSLLKTANDVLLGLDMYLY